MYTALSSSNTAAWHDCTVYWKTRARTGGHGHTDTYGKDGQLWKRRTVMEKTGSYGKDAHLWKRRTLMEKTDTKHLKPIS